MKKVSLPLLYTANQLLVEFIPILTVSYHPITKLACYIHYFMFRNLLRLDEFHLVFSRTMAILQT